MSHELTCKFPFLPVVDAAANTLHTLEKRIIVLVLAEAASYWTVISSMLSMAIPADLLYDDSAQPYH